MRWLLALHLSLALTTAVVLTGTLALADDSGHDQEPPAVRVAERITRVIARVID